MNREYWYIYITVALVLLAGCGEESAIKAAVRDDLIDPDSVKFGDLVINKEKNEACIRFNARNRMGGYSGWKNALLMKTGEGWYLHASDVHTSRCQDSGENTAKIADIERSAAIQGVLDTLDMLRKSPSMTNNQSELKAAEEARINFSEAIKDRNVNVSDALKKAVSGKLECDKQIIEASGYASQLAAAKRTKIDGLISLWKGKLDDSHASIKRGYCKMGGGATTGRG